MSSSKLRIKKLERGAIQPRKYHVVTYPEGKGSTSAVEAQCKELSIKLGPNDTVINVVQ